MSERRMSPESGLLNPLWLRSVAGRSFEAVVDDRGGVVIDGVRLVFNRSDAAIDGREKVMVKVGQWITCQRLSEFQQHVEAKERSAAAEREAAATRQDRLRVEAEAFNSRIVLPVTWKVAIKDVLSGLAEDSMGDGYNKRTVHHIQLENDAIAGKLKRAKGDFLCTSPSSDNGKQWSSSSAAMQTDGQGKPYAPRVTCKRCIKLAAIFQAQALEP